MARFFVPRKSINHQRATVEGPELDHLRKVLRLGPGDSIMVFDDAGWEHEAVIRSLSAQAAEIDLLRSVQAERESPLQLTLAVGLTKGEKMDFVVEKATELGAQAIVPFVSAYTVPKLDQRKIEKRGERWQKIALAAAKQCRRTRIPKIFALSDFEVMANKPHAPPLDSSRHRSRRRSQRSGSGLGAAARIQGDSIGPPHSSGRDRGRDRGVARAVFVGRPGISSSCFGRRHFL